MIIHRRILVLSLFAIVFGGLCSAADTPALNLIPWPKTVKTAAGNCELIQANRIVVSDSQLAPLAKVLSDDIYLISAVRLTPVSGASRPGDIVLRLNPAVAADEGYRLSVSPAGAVIEGKTYRGVASGTVTLVQALSIKGGRTSLPQMTVEDQPAHAYRGLLIDCARQWHPAQGLKDIIVMCRLYKINYIQLHLTDDQSFTFPSKAFPQLATVEKGKARHYTWEELVGLVRFADERGVTLIPELETPGHAGKLRQVEPFGRKGLGCVNMANEKTYAAFDKLIGELCEVFKSSPYIHIGTDESSMNGMGDLPEEKAYMEANKLKNVHELFQHHIFRLDQIIKKHGRKTMRWGGFTDNSNSAVKLPDDITNMVWDVHSGGVIRKIDHPIINAAWKPLYVVGSKAWLPQYLLETWHIRLWQFHMDSNPGKTVAPEVPVFGAQMCAWEQSAEAELPSLRWRLPAMCERIYNPESGRNYADFARRFAQTDVLLDTLLCPVRMNFSGLTGDPSDRAFADSLTITLSTAPQGTIHYTLDGKDPDSASPAYTGPITVKAADIKPEAYLHSRAHGRYLRTSPRLHVKVACYDPAGKIIGQVREDILYAIMPRVHTRIFISPKMIDHTRKDWMEGQDWAKLGIKPDKEVIWPNLVFSMPSASRGAVFVPLCSGILSKGRIKIPADATYAFLYGETGGEVFIDGALVTKSVEALIQPIALKAGLHDIEVRYAHPGPFATGTQSLSYAILKPGQSVKELLDPPKGKDTWNRPKKGLWTDHAELLVPLETTAKSATSCYYSGRVELRIDGSLIGRDAVPPRPEHELRMVRRNEVPFAPYAPDRSENGPCHSLAMQGRAWHPSTGGYLSGNNQVILYS
jgi:hexosaminidase